MSVQEICQTPQQAQKEIRSSFSGFLAETQQHINTAIENVPEMPLPDNKKAEMRKCLMQEQAALNRIDKTVLAKLDKPTAIAQLDSAMGSLAENSYKLAQVKGVTRAFAKANLAATTGMLYAGIRIEELEGNIMPNRAALKWVVFMEKQHDFVKTNDPAYISSKSNRLYNAIHNFYACGIRNSKDTANTSSDMSKSSMVPHQNKQYQDSTYRAIKTAGKS